MISNDYNDNKYDLLKLDGYAHLSQRVTNISFENNESFEQKQSKKAWSIS